MEKIKEFIVRGKICKYIRYTLGLNATEQDVFNHLRSDLGFYDLRISEYTKDNSFELDELEYFDLLFRSYNVPDAQLTSDAIILRTKIYNKIKEWHSRLPAIT